MNKNKIKLIIFDFDNTIVNSLSYWKLFLNKLIFKELNLKPKKNYEINSKHIENVDKIQKFINDTKVDKTFEEIKNIWFKYMSYFYTHKIKLIKGISEYLEFLKNKGYKLIIASATFKDLLMVAVKYFDLGKYFDDIISEEEYKTSKCCPLFFNKIKEKENIEFENMFLFEDSYSVLNCAKSLNISSCCIIHRYNRKLKKDLKNISLLSIKNYNNKNLKSIL